MIFQTSMIMFHVYLPGCNHGDRCCCPLRKMGAEKGPQDLRVLTPFFPSFDREGNSPMTSHGELYESYHSPRWWNSHQWPDLISKLVGLVTFTTIPKGSRFHLTIPKRSRFHAELPGTFWKNSNHGFFSSTLLFWAVGEFKRKKNTCFPITHLVSAKGATPGRLTWNIIMEVWFRSFSFPNGWFGGSSRWSSGV